MDKPSSQPAPQNAFDKPEQRSAADPQNRPQLKLDRITHPVFILSYIANLTLVTANTATFIFADWTAWLSENGNSFGTYQEELPGRIIQYGIAAALCCRLFLGQAIDRFGVRRVWIVMNLLALSGMWTFASLTELSGSVIVGRILFVTGVGGMFTCGTFHIQSCVVEHRRTEFIALLGSSGFVGMVLGPHLAELIIRLTNENRDEYFPLIFSVATGLMVAVLGCVVLVTRGITRPQRAPRPTLLRLMRAYWPGLIMGVAMAMGLTFVVPSVFLARFNQHEQLGGISTYWTAYAIMAFLFRIFTAALSQRVGRFRLVAFGLLAQGAGLWLLLPVTEWWHLIFPAILCGFGHALLFPSIVSLGTQPFPAQYRGSGTNLTLGCFDLGAGLSAPLLGRIIDLQQFDGAGYRPMFFVAGAIPLTMGIIWYLAKRHHVDTYEAPAKPEQE